MPTPKPRVPSTTVQESLARLKPHREALEAYRRPFWDPNGKPLPKKDKQARIEKTRQMLLDHLILPVAKELVYKSLLTRVWVGVAQYWNDGASDEVHIKMLPVDKDFDYSKIVGQDRDIVDEVQHLAFRYLADAMGQDVNYNEGIWDSYGNPMDFCGGDEVVIEALAPIAAGAKWHDQDASECELFVEWKLLEFDWHQVSQEIRPRTNA